MILDANGNETTEIPSSGGSRFGLMWVVGIVAGAIALTIFVFFLIGIVKLYTALQLWSLLIIFVAAIILIIVIKGKYKFNFSANLSPSGRFRWTGAILGLIAIIIAMQWLFLSGKFTRYGAKKIQYWTDHLGIDPQDKVCIPNNTVAYVQSSKNDIPRAGTYKFEANKSYFFDNVVTIHRTYAVAKKGSQTHIHFETPDGNWSGIITDNPDIAYLDGNNTPIAYGGKMSIRFDEPVVVKVVFKEVKVN